MNSESPNESLLTIRQAAKFLNVHPDTLRRWERMQKITSIRIGNRKDRRYRLEDLHELISPEASRAYPLTFKVNNRDQIKISKILKRSKWIFFDVGYTLMSLFPSRGDTYADIAYDYGYNLDPNLIQKNFAELTKEWDKEKILSEPLTKGSQITIAQHYAQFNAEILLRSGFPMSEKTKAIIVGKQIFTTIFSDFTLWKTFKGVEEFLAILKKNGKKLGIIENWDGRLTRFMKNWILDSYFNLVISGGELKLRKPDPHLFKLAIEKSGSTSSEIVYIGDRYVEDVLIPKKVGINPLLFDRERQYVDKDCLRFYTYKELIENLS